LLSLLSQQAQFFVIRNSEPVDVQLMVLALVLVLLGLAAAVAALRRLQPVLGRVSLHVCLILSSFCCCGVAPHSPRWGMVAIASALAWPA